MHVLNLPMSDENNWNSLIRLIEIKIDRFLIHFHLLGQDPHDIIDGINDGSVEIAED